MSVNVNAQTGEPQVETEFAEAEGDSIFQVYAENRKKGISNYITMDLPLVSYSILRKKSIEVAENSIVLPTFDKLLQGLNQALLGQHRTNTNSEQSEELEVLQANQQFIWLLQSLLQGEPLSELSSRTVDEYQRVISANSVQESVLWGRLVDYTQYIPRGIYTRDEVSERYFRAMRYATSNFFAIAPSAATGITPIECALQISQLRQLVQLIYADESLRALRAELDSALSWQFGLADDLTDSDVDAVLTSDDGKVTNLQFGERLLEYARDHDRQPRIVDAIVNPVLLESGYSTQDVTTGWRLLPSRFSVESSFQQAMLFGQTGTYAGNSDSLPFGYGVVGGRAVKSFPKALEWIALLGSDTAYKSLISSQDAAFEGYASAFELQRAELHRLSGAEMLQVQIMKSALDNSASQLQADSDSNRLMAFNAWHKFTNLLYNKQSYTPVAKGLVLSKQRQGTADLETRTFLYLMLAHAAREQIIQSGLPEWRDYSELMDKLAEISMKRENDTPLPEDDLNFLNSLDSSLLSLTGESDQPVIVDVHTNTNESLVVQHGTKYPTTISHYSEGALLRRGSMMNFVEFKQPMDERLTLRQWHQQLSEE